MRNDNLYKYQIENLKELDKIPEKLEEKTKGTYLIKIGAATWTYFNYGQYVSIKGDLYLITNHNSSFVFIDDLSGMKEYFTLNQILNNDLKIKFDKQMFLNINKTINKILKDNQEREKYNNKLNNQLKAINNSL